MYEDCVPHDLALHARCLLLQRFSQYLELGDELVDLLHIFGGLIGRLGVLRMETISGKGRVEVIARPAVEPHALPVLAGNNPKTIVLDLVQPLAGRGQAIGLCREARRDEPGREGSCSMRTKYG